MSTCSKFSFLFKPIQPIVWCFESLRVQYWLLGYCLFNVCRRKLSSHVVWKSWNCLLSKPLSERHTVMAFNARSTTTCSGRRNKTRSREADSDSVSDFPTESSTELKDRRIAASLAFSQSLSKQLATAQSATSDSGTSLMRIQEIR